MQRPGVRVERRVRDGVRRAILPIAEAAQRSGVRAALWQRQRKVRAEHGELRAAVGRAGDWQSVARRPGDPVRDQ